MKSDEIRKKFIAFFKSKGHKEMSPSSLIPDTIDPSVLFTTAGMQQFKGWFSGEEKPKYPRVVTIQPCLRTSDIDEVGDKTHLTFFEMLGHFSFGDYFKKETIDWTFELLTKIYGISRERILAVVFEGDETVPFDSESFEAWQKLLPESQINKGSRADNFWGPAGTEGPCGAANEVYVDGVEIATLVFMEFYLTPDKKLTPLPKKGVDVGWGFERLVRLLQKKDDVFETDIFEPLIVGLEKKLSLSWPKDKKKLRILADHSRSSQRLINEGVVPSNKGRGYVLRRLLRRILLYSPGIISEIKDKTALAELEKFQKTIERGKKGIEKLNKLDAKAVFDFYQTYGFPFELSKEYAAIKGIKIDEADFEKEFEKHKEISRQGKTKKFTKINKEKIAELHTATHILHETLRRVLGKHVEQRGQDINSERLRFDFAHPEKLTPEQLKEIEDKVNQIISQKLPVICEETSVEEAKKQGARALFLDKYQGKVTMYSVGDYSRELCKGPHVKNTSELGHFKIIKEEASSAGVRRIKAILG
ncbi:MAG: alanyl-tRNA synthetase [Candidatus Berkelbacteria bacterium Licking1014_96]|uniref:alanine--tRNA ligase n=1 Tax=Candidatus Berkelbacteria bacterium Licking1014_96 TaxID=2017149 RepID=A0A554LD41_9BACT|nr:MAG: alanyl-tRNA synthetase [Candidatus Berkelbacteria bacterium Licking1014_96]